MTIAPSQIVEREMNLQETHVYQFDLNAGEFARFEIEQKNVDPQLIIGGADGGELRRMYFEKIVGGAAISFIAAEKARFRLTIKPSGKSAMNGNYRLRMSAPRSADENDRKRITAEIVLDGDGWAWKKTPTRAEKPTADEWRVRLAALQNIVGEWQKLNEPIYEQETWHQIGIAADRVQNDELKQTALEKSLALARSNSDVFGEARALGGLAKTAARRGDREAEEKNLLKAAELVARVNAKTAEAEFFDGLASHYADSGKNEQSRDYLLKEAEIYRALNLEVKEAKARASLALIAGRLDPKIDSSAVYQSLLPVFERNKAFYEKAGLLRSLGGYALEKKQFEAAEKYFTDALALMEKYGEPEDEAFVLLGFGLSRFNQTKFAEAADYLEKALAKLDDFSKPATRIRVLNAQARTALLQGKVLDAMAKIKIALELADKIKLQHERIILNALLSQIYAALGQSETAFKHALAAKKLSEEIRDKLSQAAAAVALSLVYQFRGDYPAAVALLEEGVNTGEEFDQYPLISAGYQRLGGLFAELGDFKRAENSYLKAAAAAEKSGNATIKKSVALSLAHVQLHRNRFAEAKANIEAVLAAARVDRDVLIEAYAEQMLGNLALKEKDFAAARIRFNNALVLQTKAKLVLGIALSAQGLGDASVGLDDFAEAQTVYEQALGAFRQIGSATGEATIFENLMNLEIKKGRRRAAIFYGKQSVNLLQTVRGAIKPLESEIRRNFLSSVEDAYRTLAAILLEEGRIVEARQVLSLLKEEEFYQYTRRSPAAAPDVPRRLSFTHEENDFAQKEAGEKLKPPPAPEMIAAPVPAEEIWRKKLAESGEAVLLTTLLTENRYYVILTTADAQTVRRVEISQPDLNRKIVRLREILEDPRSDPLPLTQELYGILIKPIEADLAGTNAKTLLWSLDGALRYVPLAALHDGRNFLVEKYANALVTLAQPPDAERAAPEKWRALGAGVSAAAGNLPPLPRVADELKAVVRDEAAKNPRRETGVFAGRRLLDKEFSRANFGDALRRKNQLVHLATHFVFQPGKDTDSFLLLGDNDKISLADWQTDEAFDLSGVELLTLSACETAVGATDASGVEIESLGVIARRRGANTVLASLWSIADNATPQLLTEFYRQYRSGKGAIPKAEILRRAQLTLLKNKSRQNYRHPAYWGAFIFIGNL